MKNFKKYFSLILISVLFAAMTLSMVGCGKSAPNTATEASSSNELGEGAKTFTFTCTDLDGNVKEFTIHSDAATVGEALVANDLIKGEESDWGLYVKEVCGIVADYDVDGHYWAFYINDEYAMTGVDATELTDGSAYAFKVE